MNDCCKREVEQALDEILERIKICRKTAFALVDEDSINELKRNKGIEVKK